MDTAAPEVPVGTGTCPVVLVELAAADLERSAAFYRQVFRWSLHATMGDAILGTAPVGTHVVLRRPAVAPVQAVIPFVHTTDVEATLARVLAHGGTVLQATHSVDPLGKLARFRDACGTVYGLTECAWPDSMPMPRMPAPTGANPKPVADALCSLEMFAADGAAAADFFGDVFGWGSAVTMPQYMAFDPGAGMGGVFQSHTPSAPAMAYIFASDVTTKLAEVESAGGKRMGDPMAIAGFATFAYFTDPSGTAMGLIGP